MSHQGKYWRSIVFVSAINTAFGVVFSSLCVNFLGASQGIFVSYLFSFKFSCFMYWFFTDFFRNHILRFVISYFFYCFALGVANWLVLESLIFLGIESLIVGQILSLVVVISCALLFFGGWRNYLNNMLRG